jgi:hypothetical protein
MPGESPQAPGSPSKKPGPNGPKFEKPVSISPVQAALKAGPAGLLTVLEPSTKNAKDGVP